MKKVLLYARIPSHLKIILDLALFLKNSKQFEPIILFYSEELFLLAKKFSSEFNFKYNVYIKHDPETKKITKQQNFLYQEQIVSYLKKKLIRLAHVLFLSYTLFFYATYSVFNFSKLKLNLKFFTHKKFHQNMKQFLLEQFALVWSEQMSQNNFKDKFLTKMNKVFFKFIIRNVAPQKDFSQFIHQLIQKESIHSIVLPEDNFFYNTHIMNYHAKLSKIPAIIVPFTIVNQLEWAEAFYDEPSFNANYGINRLFAKLFPHWVMEYKNKKLILPARYILSTEYLNLVPKTPWLINSGVSDYIAVENQFMYQYYQQSGIEQNKLIITGALNDDKIFKIQAHIDNYRLHLEKQLNIQFKKNIVLIALPPNQFDLGVKPSVEFKEYSQLIDFMMKSVAEQIDEQTTVLVNLHPRIEPQDVLPIIEKYQFVYAPQAVEELIPLSQLYIAVVSATIRTALSCGVPVINYDAYHYDYIDFNHLNGVIEVRMKQQYQHQLKDILQFKDYYQHLKTEQETLAKQYFKMDGKAGDRILQLIEQSIKEPVIKYEPV